MLGIIGAMHEEAANYLSLTRIYLYVIIVKKINDY